MSMQVYIYSLYKLYIYIYLIQFEIASFIKPNNMMNIKLLKGVGISCMVKHVHSNRFYYGSSSTIYGVMIGDERCKVGNERLITDN